MPSKGNSYYKYKTERRKNLITHILPSTQYDLCWYNFDSSKRISYVHCYLDHVVRLSILSSFCVSFSLTTILSCLSYGRIRNDTWITKDSKCLYTLNTLCDRNYWNFVGQIIDIIRKWWCVNHVSWSNTSVTYLTEYIVQPVIDVIGTMLDASRAHHAYPSNLNRFVILMILEFGCFFSWYVAWLRSTNKFL